MSVDQSSGHDWHGSPAGTSLCLRRFTGEAVTSARAAREVQSSATVPASTTRARPGARPRLDAVP